MLWPINAVDDRSEGDSNSVLAGCWKWLLSVQLNQPNTAHQRSRIQLNACF